MIPTQSLLVIRPSKVFHSLGFCIHNIDGTLTPTVDMTKIKLSGIKDYIILTKIALHFGLQYKPSSGAEWEKICIPAKSPGFPVSLQVFHEISQSPG